MAAAVIAPGAPTASSGRSLGLLASLTPAAGPAVQFVGNGAVAGATRNLTRTAAAVAGSEWPDRLAVHAADVTMAGVLLAYLRDAAAKMRSETRGSGAGQVPALLPLVAMYVVQAHVRYTLGDWTSGPDENLKTLGVIDLTSGSIAVTASLMHSYLGPAPQPLPDGITTAATPPAQIVDAQGNVRTGWYAVTIEANAGVSSVVQALALDNLADSAAKISAFFVGAELVGSGHHYMSSNAKMQELIAKHDAMFQSLAQAVGESSASMKSMILHKALHSVSATAYTSFFTSAHAAGTYKVLGFEALAVRLPFTSAEISGMRAMLAIIQSYETTTAKARTLSA